MSLYARAPMRIDWAGGWTDVPVFAEQSGGAVVNAAISLAAHVDFIPGDNRIRLRAEDLGERISLASSREIVYDGKLDLHKAALNT
ncbi:MAG: GHMP kinase, partial [Gemmatimonadales bacterium]